jgi:hypothetical protein
MEETRSPLSLMLMTMNRSRRPRGRMVPPRMSLVEGVDVGVEVGVDDGDRGKWWVPNPKALRSATRRSWKKIATFSLLRAIGIVKRPTRAIAVVVLVEMNLGVRAVPSMTTMTIGTMIGAAGKGRKKTAIHTPTTGAVVRARASRIAIAAPDPTRIENEAREGMEDGVGGRVGVETTVEEVVVRRSSSDGSIHAVRAKGPRSRRSSSEVKRFWYRSSRKGLATKGRR